MEPGLATAPSCRGLGSACPLQPRGGLAPACLSSAGGRGCRRPGGINPSPPLLCLYLRCLENRGTAPGKAGVQTAPAAPLRPGPSALGLPEDIKTINSELSAESFSPFGSPAALKCWDLNPCPSPSTLAHTGHRPLGLLWWFLGFKLTARGTRSCLNPACQGHSWKTEPLGADETKQRLHPQRV